MKDGIDTYINVIPPDKKEEKDTISYLYGLWFNEEQRKKFISDLQKRISDLLQWLYDTTKTLFLKTKFFSKFSVSATVVKVKDDEPILEEISARYDRPNFISTRVEYVQNTIEGWGFLPKVILDKASVFASIAVSTPIEIAISVGEEVKDYVFEDTSKMEQCPVPSNKDKDEMIQNIEQVVFRKTKTKKEAKDAGRQEGFLYQYEFSDQTISSPADLSKQFAKYRKAQFWKKIRNILFISFIGVGMAVAFSFGYGLPAFFILSGMLTIKVLIKSQINGLDRFLQKIHNNPGWQPATQKLIAQEAILRYKHRYFGACSETKSALSNDASMLRQLRGLFKALDKNNTKTLKDYLDMIEKEKLPRQFPLIAAYTQCEDPNDKKEIFKLIKKELENIDLDAFIAKIEKKMAKKYGFFGLLKVEIKNILSNLFNQIYPMNTRISGITVSTLVYWSLTLLGVTGPWFPILFVLSMIVLKPLVKKIDAYVWGFFPTLCCAIDWLRPIAEFLGSTKKYDLQNKTNFYRGVFELKDIVDEKAPSPASYNNACMNKDLCNAKERKKTYLFF